MNALGMRRSARGFTLVELMIVLAIVGVLATIALPSFADALARSRRMEAVTALLQLQLAQERWRADHAGYADATAALGVPAGTATGHHTLAILQAGSDGYVATATAARGDDEHCRVLKLTQDGGRIGYTSVDASEVEASAAPNRCWMP